MRSTTFHLLKLFASTLMIGVFVSMAMSRFTSKPAMPKVVSETGSAGRYKAIYGMVYGAVEAKRYNYVCPMDHPSMDRGGPEREAPPRDAHRAGNRLRDRPAERGRRIEGVLDHAGLGHGRRPDLVPLPRDDPSLAGASTVSGLVEDANRFFEAMDTRREKKVFVHCAMNMRVSAFMYLYRTLREGMPEEEAAKDLRRIWQPDERWQAFIEEVRSAGIGTHRQ